MSETTKQLTMMMAALTTMEADQTNNTIMAENDAGLALSNKESDDLLFETRMELARNNRLLEAISSARRAVEKAACQSEKVDEAHVALDNKLKAMAPGQEE